MVLPIPNLLRCFECYIEVVVSFKSFSRTLLQHCLLAVSRKAILFFTLIILKACFVLEIAFSFFSHVRNALSDRIKAGEIDGWYFYVH